MFERVIMYSRVRDFSFLSRRGGMSTLLSRKKRLMTIPCKKTSFFLTTYEVQSVIGISFSNNS